MTRILNVLAGVASVFLLAAFGYAVWTRTATVPGGLFAVAMGVVAVPVAAYWWRRANG